MRTLMQDVRFAGRMLMRNPGFAVVAILTLALGIGANSAIFSVVNAVLFKPLPYANPDGLVKVWGRFTGVGLANDQMWFSAPEFRELTELNRSLSEPAVLSAGPVNLGVSGNPQSVKGAVVSPSMFSLLGVNPMLGRAFTADEAEQGHDRVLILSYSLWQRAFGSDPQIVGKEVALDGRTCQVIGVMPRGFDYPFTAELWTPQVFTAKDFDPNNRGNHGYEVLARLKPGVTFAQAREDMDAVAKTIIERNRSYPYQRYNYGLMLHPLLEETVGDVKSSLWVLMGAVGFVLLLVCANVAGLLLSRSTARQKEIAVRVALGAGTRRIVRQLLTESVLLSLFGGLLGLFFTPLFLQIIVTLSATALPRVIGTQIDVGPLLFTFGLIVCTGIVFGLAPALEASRGARYEILKEGGRTGSDSRSSQKLRRVFVAAEAALAVVLLAGSGLLLRSFVKLLAVDPGFRADGVLTLQIALPPAKYGKPEQARNFYRELVARVQHVPGVQAAGAVSNLPLTTESSGTCTVDSRVVSGNDASPEVDQRVVTPGYFEAMGISLISGRYFDEHDSETSAPVAIIDDTMASAYWPNEDPIGKRIKVGLPATKLPWMTIVGVVRHVRYRSLETRSRTQMYWLEAQLLPTTSMGLAIRTAGNPMSLAPTIQKLVLDLDAEQSIDHVVPMYDLMADSLARRRLTLSLLGAFAVGAMLLAALGIYGVVAYMVSQRQQEIGVRMAIGASRAAVLGLVIKQGMSLMLVGLAAGLVLSVLVNRVLSTLLFAVRPYDPLSLAAAAGVLGLVALIACALPAWRATRVDPLVAPRYE